MKKLIIETRKINDLIAADYNPRQSNEHQEKKLRESLEQFGCVEPVIINSFKDRENVIVGGHFRVRELKKLGVQKIECVVVNLSLKKERELNLRLNKNTGDFDFDILANEFEIEELLEVGFTDDELGLTNNDSATILEEKAEFWIGVQCENETDQQQLYEELQEKGYKCKLMN